MGRYVVSLSSKRGFSREGYVLGARSKLMSLGLSRGKDNDGSLVRTAMQRGAGLKDWRDYLSEEEKAYYRSNGMADKKGRIWKDAYTIGAKIRARKGFDV